MVSRALFIIVLAYCVTAGCAQQKLRLPKVQKLPKIPRMTKTGRANSKVPMPPPPPTHLDSPFQVYVARNFDWPSVQRIVLMPLANQTSYPKVMDEIRTNLATELQRAGRFEIVVATHEDAGTRAQDVFTHGQFNELEILRVAREYQADAVLFANVTQYHPYSPPRVGVSLLLVSPAEGIAIASIDGLWDAREGNTAAQAQAYFKQTQNWSRSLFGADRIIESPDVFQRFVCQQISVSLYPSAAGSIGPAGSIAPGGPMMQPGGVMPANATIRMNGDPPPMPPGSNEHELSQ